MALTFDGRRAAQSAAWAWLLILAGLGLIQLAGLLTPDLTADLTNLTQPPSTAHILGTDPFGRDVVATLLAGTRTLFVVSLPAALLTSLLGCTLGAAAGYWGNQQFRIPYPVFAVLLLTVAVVLLSTPAWAFWYLLGGILAAGFSRYLPFRKQLAIPLDSLVTGIMALLGAVPRFLLVLLLAAFYPPSEKWLVAVLVTTCWVATARHTRILVQQLRQQSYVEAGIAAGFSARRLVWQHIRPNAWPGLRTTLPLNLSVCLGLQTTLTFLGLGLPPDQPDWGHTLAQARLEPSAWWLLVGGVLPLLLTLTALNQVLNTTKIVSLLSERMSGTSPILSQMIKKI